MVEISCKKNIKCKIKGPNCGPDCKEYKWNGITRPSNDGALSIFRINLFMNLSEFGWSEKDLAEMSGLPLHHINSYLKMNIMPTKDALESIAKAFRIKPEDMV